MTSPTPEQVDPRDLGTEDAVDELTLEQLALATGGYVSAGIGVNVNTGTLGRFNH